MNKRLPNILVVEDDIDVQDSICEILEINGFVTRRANNVKNAIEKINDEIPDLIISDIVMPELSGMFFLEAVRNNPEFANIPFIFLTAQSQTENIRSGMNLGADDYLTKPFRLSDLLSSVKLRLEKKSKIENKLDLIFEGISKYVPHELRTPLVAILGYPQIIKDNFDELEKTKIFELLDNISFGGRRMLNTLEKFIIYSDLKSNELKNKFKLNSSITSKIEKVIESVNSELSQYIDRWDDLNIEVEDYELKMDSAHLAIIIKQLLENAYKFSKKESKVTVIGKLQKNCYQFVIVDNGFGMTKENISNIGPFSQFNRNINQQSGNGLGLAIVNELLGLYKSKLKIESEVSNGTKISFRIPITTNL
ncbi:MAG: response regulator [Ignavibacteriae bacterium]|nr:response regulator [Ignavibacteriota bacterium]